MSAKSSKSQPESDAEHFSVLDVLRKIQTGSLDPSQLAPGDRRVCVVHLSGEGYSVVEMAQVLKTSERTIARDRKAIQEANAIERSPQLAAQMVGKLMGEAELAISRIRRFTRDGKTPPATKVEGERACYQIVSDLFQRLQHAGYIPTAAQKISAQVLHVEADGDLAGLQDEWRRVEGIGNELGIEDPLSKRNPRLPEIISQLLSNPSKEGSSNDHPDTQQG